MILKTEQQATADAMLRASVQSALEGIRSSVNHLQAASENVKHIGERFAHIQGSNNS